MRNAWHSFSDVVSMPARGGASLQIHREAGAILNLDPDILPGFIAQALREHQRLISSGANQVLKNAAESAVTRVDLPNMPPVCVKEFRWRGTLHAVKSFFRPTQGKRTAVNGWRLRQAGFSAACPLAIVRKTRWGLVTAEGVVMEVIPRYLELDRYLVHRIRSGWPSEERRGLARLMGRFISSLHSAGIFHSDLKTCNILISDIGQEADDLTLSGQWRPLGPGGTLRFSLVDYDDVRFYHAVPPRKRIKNLVQIFLSMPTAVSASDRLRFLHEYALHMGLTVAERRKVALRVLRAARGRDILYVGFNGDVVEKWDWSDSAAGNL